MSVATSVYAEYANEKLDAWTSILEALIESSLQVEVKLAEIEEVVIDMRQFEFTE